MKIIKTKLAILKLSQTRGPVGPDNPSSDDLGLSYDMGDTDRQEIVEQEGISKDQEYSQVQNAAREAGIISEDERQLIKPGYYSIRFDDGYAITPLEGPYVSIQSAIKSIPNNIMGDEKRPIYTKVYSSIL